MISDKLYLGKKSEEEAVSFLKKKGYRILVRNYNPGAAEIDIIAKDKGTIAFIEVKSRQSDRFGLACEAVQLKKQRQISKAALLFLKQNNLLDSPARFDVVAIDYSPDKGAQCEIFKDAFNLGEEFTY